MMNQCKQGESACVDPKCVCAGQPTVRKLTNQYALHDVFNMGETTFYYQMETRGLWRDAHV